MRVLLFFFSVLGLLIMLNSNSGGRAAVKRQGNTGAPGDHSRVCKSCHSGNRIQVAMSIQLMDSTNKVVDSYQPETEYTVRVKVEPTAGDPKAFGFQMVCLNAELGQNGSDIKNWLKDPDKVYHIADASNGRTYVEHDKPNRKGGIFDVKWKAPAAGTGTLSFYAAGNGVNLNGSTTGDGATRTSLEVKESIHSASSDLLDNNLFQWSVWPNPTSDILHVVPSNDLAVQSTHTIRAELYNSYGKLVLSDPLKVSTLSLLKLSPGIYFIKLFDEKKLLYTGSVIKLR